MDYCNSPKSPLEGHVYVNGQPAWPGFGVKATAPGGAQRWALVTGNDGYYQFHDDTALPMDVYSIHHNYPCSSNTPVDVWIPSDNNRGPDIFVECPKYDIVGNVYVNGQKAHQGFALQLWVGTDGRWAEVDENGIYRFPQVPEGDYKMVHWACDVQHDVAVHVPMPDNRIPDIWVDCPKPEYTVWGRVMIDGQPGHEGFTVRLKNKETGLEFWPAVSGGDGWYSKPNVPEGLYLVTHYDESCPGNNNFDTWVGENATIVPAIELMCPTPQPKYTVSGVVTIDGKPAHLGFGVLIEGIGWTLIDNPEGRYTFNNVPAGTYTVRHNYICPTQEGNPQVFAVDGRIGPSFTIVCPSTAPIVTPAPGEEATCSEILTGLGISAASSLELSNPLFLPIVAQNNLSSPSTPAPTPTATPTQTPIPTPSPTQTTIPAPTATNTTVPTAIPTNTVVPTATPIQTEPGQTPIPTETSLPTPTATPSPTATVPVTSGGYVMDSETFIRLATKLDDIEEYITTTTTISPTQLVFDHETARGAGFAEDLIDLTNQMVTFENDLLSPDVSAASVLTDTDPMAGYPLLEAYMEAATSYANNPVAAAAMNEVRGLSMEKCVCGSELSPRPSSAAPNTDLATFDERSKAEEYIATNHSDFYLPFVDWWGDGTLPKGKWDYVKPYSWQSDRCGQETYQDNIHIIDPVPTSPQVWKVTIQDYSTYTPRGEPGVDIKLHSGPLNWPYLSWPFYVFWWHVWGPGK